MAISSAKVIVRIPFRLGKAGSAHRVGWGSRSIRVDIVSALPTVPIRLRISGWGEPAPRRGTTAE